MLSWSVSHGRLLVTRKVCAYSLTRLGAIKNLTMSSGPLMLPLRHSQRQVHVTEYRTRTVLCY